MSNIDVFDHVAKTTTIFNKMRIRFVDADSSRVRVSDLPRHLPAYKSFIRISYEVKQQMNKKAKIIFESYIIFVFARTQHFDVQKVGI